MRVKAPYQAAEIENESQSDINEIIVPASFKIVEVKIKPKTSHGELGEH
jgi:hypothetical protein